MRTIPIILLLLTFLSGCNSIGVNIGVGSGAGIGVAFNVNGDFLYSGTTEVYDNNQRGLKEFLAKDYFAAEQIFRSSLELSPNNPDATYYLGLTLIYEDKRDEGFALLLNYKDFYKTRIAQEVRWWAAYCQKKPALTAEKIHQTMNKARNEGYRRQQEEDLERRRW